MEYQVKLQRVLLKEFINAKAKNPSFSVRAFARRIGLQPSATNEILKGQRRVSRKLATKILNKLNLDPVSVADVLEEPSLKRSKKAKQDVLRLNADQFEAISNWVHYAILSLIRTKDFRSDPEWIASRLGVSQSQVTQALDRMCRLEMISVKNGKIQRLAKPLRTSEDTLDLSIQKSHLQDLELIRRAIQELATTERDVSSMTMPLSLEKLAEAKVLIREFQEQLASLVIGNSAEEVYRVSVSFFPLTKILKSGDSL